MASKNQRVAKKAERPGVNAGEQKLIVPLNGGKHAYIRVDSQVKHVATDSDTFAEVVTSLGEERAPKVRAELEALHAEYPANGWDATIGRLETAGAL